MTRILTVLILASLTVGQLGCTCRRPFLNWWNRGDSCETCASGDCIPTSAVAPGPNMGTSMLGSPGISDSLFAGEHLASDPIISDGIPSGAVMGAPISGPTIIGPSNMGSLPGPR